MLHKKINEAYSSLSFKYSFLDTNTDCISKFLLDVQLFFTSSKEKIPF